MKSLNRSILNSFPNLGSRKGIGEVYFLFRNLTFFLFEILNCLKTSPTGVLNVFKILVFVLVKILNFLNFENLPPGVLNVLKV